MLFRSRLIPRAELAESGSLAPSDWQRVFDALKSATYTSPDITLTALLTRDGEGRWYKLHAHTLWSQDEKPQFIAAIGCFTDIHEHMLRHTAPFAKSGIAMTGIAACVLVPIYSVYPPVGRTLMLPAFVVVVIGGLSSIPGALIAGLLVGVVESLSAYFLGSSYQQLAYFVLFILVILLKPEGILARRKKGV